MHLIFSPKKIVGGVCTKPACSLMTAKYDLCLIAVAAPEIWIFALGHIAIVNISINCSTLHKYIPSGFSHHFHPIEV